MHDSRSLPRRLMLLLWLLSATLGAFAKEPAPPPLEVVVLGSGGPGALGRAGACYLVLIDGTPRVLVDAGPGAFVRLGEADLSLARTNIVLLTHLHADHAGGLPGLVKARAVSARGKIAFEVFGPAGRLGSKGDASFPSTKKFIDLLFGASGAFGYLRDFSAPLSFKVTDLNTAISAKPLPRQILVEGDLVISVIAGHHRDAPAVIYRIDYKGRSVTFSGDIDSAGHAGLRRLAAGTSLLVFHAAVLDPPRSPPQLYELHTPPKEIGEIAADVKAGKLLLSHLSPATEGERDDVSASIRKRYAGELSFAEDGMRVQP